MSHNEPIVLALPKGRILEAALPLLKRAGIEPEAAFGQSGSRKLWFESNHDGLRIIRVRGFDVATFVAFGGAQLGVVGSDVLMEHDYSELYVPLDLGFGRCRMIVAEPAELERTDDPRRWSHVRVATKYPNVAKRHFEARGVQAECIRLSGAMELAPKLGLCRRIVDLVETGSTLKANGLVEVEHIADVSSRLIVNRAAMKIRPADLGQWIDRIRGAIDGA